MHNFQNTIEIRGVVQPDMMKSGVGEIVLDAIYSAADDGARPSPDVVRAVLEERGQLTESCEELVEEAWDTGFSSNAVDRVAQTVTKQYTRRALHDFGKQLSDRASSNAMDPSELQEWAEQTLMHLSTKGRSASMRSMREVVDSTMERIQEAMDAEDGVVGVPSGLHAVDNITGGFQPGKLYLVAGRPGMGKCLEVGTLVRMADGSTKPIEDIEVGESVMGPDSEPRRVLSTTTGFSDLYTIRQKSADNYTVNNRHVLSLIKSRKEGAGEKGSIKDLEIGDYLTKSDKWKSSYKGFKRGFDLPKQDVPIPPYILGAWLGDGNLRDGRMTLGDEEIIHRIKEIDEFEVRADYKPDKNSWNVGLNKKEGDSLHTRLKSLGLLGERRIPRMYIENSRDVRLRLLAGLIDTDGHIDPSQHSPYRIISKYESLAFDIKELADTLGFSTYMTEKEAKSQDWEDAKTYYRVTIGGNTGDVPCFVPRKSRAHKKRRCDHRNTGIEVEKKGRGEYAGFTLSGDSRFLLADGTVTHNSAYAGVCMRNSAKEGYGNLGFLLEMTAEGYAARQLGQAARVNSFRAEHGRISENELKSLTEGSRELEQLPIWLDDEPGLDLAEIKSRARKGVAQHDVDIVWIDYVQLIKNTANSREQEVAGISREMKGLAKSLDIPVVALAQLNRSVDKRGGDGRPKLSDLRDSGQLEQDADMVQFVYRAEQYGIEVDEHGNSTDGLGEIIVAKHRGGPLGTATLAWNADYAEFENLPEDEAAF